MTSHNSLTRIMRGLTSGDWHGTLVASRHPDDVSQNRAGATTPAPIPFSGDHLPTGSKESTIFLPKFSWGSTWGSGLPTPPPTRPLTPGPSPARGEGRPQLAGVGE